MGHAIRLQDALGDALQIGRCDVRQARAERLIIVRRESVVCKMHELFGLAIGRCLIKQCRDDEALTRVAEFPL